MSPLMKWTSLESLSSFATATEHLRLRAMLRALASCGRSSSASLVCLDFGKFSDNQEPVRLREALQCLALGLKPEAQSLLP
jgi:hypothetical protein